MKYRKALALCPLLALLPSAAFAHALFVSPKPRDNVDGWKELGTRGFMHPCGAVRKAGQPVTLLKTGGTISVSWAETVNHPGCFLLDFSEDEKTFTLLANFKHRNTPAITAAAPRPYMTSITLPADIKCDSCILRLRQVMLRSEAAACPPPGVIDPNDLYYSCANVVISDSGPGDAGASPDAGRADAAATGRDTQASGGSGGGVGAGGMTGAGGSVTTPGTGGATPSPGGQGGVMASPGRGGTTGTAPVVPDPGPAAEAPGSSKKTKDSGGCALGGGTNGLGVLALGLLAAIGLGRRRRA